MLLLSLTTYGAYASNILLFATVGARSHQFALLRVGQELTSRGHNLTLLLSSEEGLDRQGLGKHAFDELNIVTFAGPRGIGTQEWFANQPPDVTQVCMVRPDGYSLQSC